MNQATKQAAITCQEWAAHYAKQAAHHLQAATSIPDTADNLMAIRYQRLAEINAATARAILAD